MGRKDFIRDLKDAAKTEIPNVSNVHVGDDDGTIGCTYAFTADDSTVNIDLALVIPDLSLYPNGHDCLIYAVSDEVPSQLSELLERASVACAGLSVPGMLNQIAFIQRMREQSLQPDGYDSDDGAFFGSGRTSHREEHSARIKADFKACRDAGFRVGCYSDPGLFCISIRVSKLGISPETQEAWKLESRQYIVCLLHYKDSYVPFDKLMESGFADAGVDIYVGLCDKYKPTMSQATFAVTNGFGPDRIDSESKAATGGRITSLFIGESLNALMRQHFWRIMSAKSRHGFSWSGAELYNYDSQGTRGIQHSHPNYRIEDLETGPAYGTPPSAFTDHLTQRMASEPITMSVAQTVSLPLVVMQFALRHLVKWSNKLSATVCFTSKTMTISKGLENYYQPVREGDYMLLNMENRSLLCRAKRVKLPKIELADDLMLILATVSPRKQEVTFEELTSMYDTHVWTSELRLWDRDFDLLDTSGKCRALRFLLDLMPSVFDMQKFVKAEGAGVDWWRMMPKPVYNVLRWIVSSNRSCIVLDDDTEAKAGLHADKRLFGMDGYVQFRFAQGAPDKEQRFNNAVLETQRRRNTEVPTLYAWHGSLLRNWHSILREGLNFDKVVNGRSFGNGIYMAPSFTSSAYYSRGGLDLPWPQSVLGVTSAISLQEVVNSPSDFVSSHPHFVVNDPGWVQTRYLFVKCTSFPNMDGLRREHEPESVKQQDARFHAHGVNGLVKIPAPEPPQDHSEHDGYESDEPDLEDKSFFYQEEALETRPNHCILDPSQTDFRPNISHPPLTVRQLGPPPYASSAVTKTLLHDLKATVDLQKHAQQHMLGWYLNPELIQTPYQWLVEMHTFDQELPLARDLRDAGITSVLIEVNFSANHPVAPPFVRVVRPRFLPFIMGGGGHVTQGGSMCMELLTSTGWSAASAMESVLLQIKLALSSLEPRPARLEPNQSVARGTIKSYDARTAYAAYLRVCGQHGWQVPEGFNKISDWALHGSN
ncbi:Sorting nexin, cytoplasm-to-vacuole targeting pathway/endosomal sorting [Ascosphaera pollenicola]|nr:Sorting nexin, cytoplasm-to-vacuole targeting pathway/endosomal sorting [Ascosphaera pollenicola]